MDLTSPADPDLPADPAYHRGAGCLRPQLSGPIAAIVPCPFPANHGTPGSVREIIENQVAYGYDVHVFTYPIQDGPPLDPRIKVHRVGLFGSSEHITVGPTYLKPLWDLLIVFKLCRLARRYQFSVIHGYNYEGALFGWLARLWTRKPLVFEHFNTMIDELASYDFIKPRWLANMLARTLDYWVPRLATRIVTISPPSEAFLLSQGVRRERIVQIPMGIDPTIFQGGDGEGVRREYNLDRRPVIMYTGLINHFQRIDYLIEAMAVVAERQPDARLMLVTNYIESRDLEELDALLEQHGLQDSVIRTTPQPLERVADFLAAADVCVVPRPNCPGVPVKLLNYMAAGKSIVVPQGSSMNLRDRIDALVTSDDDSAAIGHAILELLADPQLRTQLEANAPVTLEQRFSLQAICRQLGDVYADIDRSQS